MIRDFIDGVLFGAGCIATAWSLSRLKYPRGYQPLPSTNLPPPPMPSVKPARKPCRACYGGDLPCACRRSSPVPYVPPQWEREEGGVDYKWLGMTGSEQE